MTISRAVRARLLRRWTELRGLVTLRRHEKRWTTYALRLTCLALILVVLPVKKVTQLGVLGALIGFLKVAVAVALVVGVLAAVFAAEEWLRRRRLKTSRA
jgi:hypothetical protein